MARDTKAEPLVRFRGIPASLTAVVAEGVDPDLEMRVSATLPDSANGGIDAGVQADVDPRILRLMLADQVPPGRYDGTLYFGDGSRPARLEIEPAPLLHVVPEQLRVDAHPGDLVGVDLTVLNQGNVPIALRGVQAIGVFMEGGLERALRRAYVNTPAKGERRMDVIADGLAAAHGGLLRMKIGKGAGVIDPGEVRELEAVLHVPAGLESGAVYTGNWELAGMVYPITIHVAGSRVPSPGDDGETPGEPDDGPPATIAAALKKTSAKAAPGKTAAKKATAKKTARKKSAAKKSAAKKTAAKKSARKKSAVKKSAVKKSAVKKSAATKSAATTSAAT